MSNTLLVKFKLFAPQIWQQTVRHRGKLNLKIPRPRHQVARYLEEITKPIIVRQVPDQIEQCLSYKARTSRMLKQTTDDAIEFEKFLATHALGLIEKHNVMLICHKLPCSGEVYRRNKVAFKKNDTEIWTFNTITMKVLMEQYPKYANLSPVVESGFGKNYYFFFDEKNLKKNLTALKRIPHFLMFGGLIHGRLYTRNGVMAYADLEPLETVREQLCAILNHQLSSTANLLVSPINNLSLALQQHAKSDESANTK